MNDDRPVIVIGSGPSGAMAAHTLLQQGIPVTMLESGDRYPGGLLLRTMGRNVFRRRPSFGDPKRHVASADPDALWYHALVPGGMSNYWTGAVPRFAPEDFFDGERLHERYRWPVSYEDLVPYYERAERLLVVVAAPQAVANLPTPRVAHRRQLPADWRRIVPHAASLGHGLAPIPLADGPPWLLARSGHAFNSFSGIVRTLLNRQHFHLRLGAHALRLEWSGADQKVHSVIYYDRATGCERRLSGAAVIVAAGPLASTKLLFDSSCGDFPMGLGDTEGLLGRYLHDHVHDYCLIELNKPLSRLGHAAYLTRAPYRQSAPLLAAQCTIGTTSMRDKILSATPLKATTFGVVIFGSVIPRAENHVRLDPRQRDEFGLPKLDLHVRFDDEASRTIEAARERLAEVFDAAGYRCTVRSPLPRLVPGTAVHYGGTVRMHSSPRHGMLNAWNRLHAVDNVAVVDASSFTTGVEKNPTLTAMALASRAAHRLAADLKSE